MSEPSFTCPVTMKRIIQIVPPPLFLGGAAPGAPGGGGADGGPGGGADGGPAGGAGGVVLIRGAPSFRAFLPCSAPGVCHTDRDAKPGPRVRCERSRRV